MISGDILCAAEAALGAGDVAAVQDLAARALPRDCLVRTVQHLYRDKPTAGARMLVKLLAVRALGAAGPSDARMQGAKGEDAAHNDGDGAAARRPTVVLVGGIGHMRADYERLAHQAGFVLRFVENGVLTLGALRPAAVLVVVSHCSRPLAAQAESFARRVGLTVLRLPGPGLLQLERALGGVRCPSA